MRIYVYMNMYTNFYIYEYMYMYICIYIFSVYLKHELVWRLFERYRGVCL